MTRPLLRGRRPRPIVAAMAPLLAALLVLAACTDPTRTDNGSGGGAEEDTTLNAYLYQAPKPNWSPTATAHGPDEIVMNLIYDTLLGTNGKFELEPRLAAEMPEVSEDGRTVTYTLADDAQWSDGEPLTAEDVVFTYNLMADPQTGSPFTGWFSNVEGAAAVASGKTEDVSGFSAPDEKTFQVSFTEPDLGFIGLASDVFILPEHILGDVARNKIGSHEFFTENPEVSSGPYTFTEYKPDQYVHLTTNPEFRGGEPAIDNIYLRPVSSDVATQQLGTGEMQLVQISPTDLEAVQKMDNVETASAPGAGFIRLGVNQEKPYLQDKRLRQAMLYAIDRKGLIDQALAGKGTALNTSFTGDEAPDDLTHYGYDPEKAKALLKEMNWDSSQQIELAIIPGQRDRDTAATVIEEQLKAVGIKINIKQVQPGELTEKLDSNSIDTFLFGGGNYKTEPWEVYPIDACEFAYPKGGNMSKWCNKEFDKLMQQANRTVDDDKRLELYQQASRIENEEVPYIWLYNADTVWAHSSDLKGFVPHGDQTAGFWNVTDWTLEGSN